MVFVGFFSANNLPELASTILFFPLTLYFGMLTLPHKSRALVIPEVDTKRVKTKTVSKNPLVKTLQKEKPVGDFDIERRRFLKLISTAGVTLFLFSIFTRRAQAAFFGSVPGPGTVSLKDSSGTVIDPAISTPTDGYKISDIDSSTPAYYGFTEKSGKWFIMREGSSGDYRYAKGSSAFSTNWTSRASLTYDYFDNVF